MIDNRTRVIVVQHPREQFHPLNTARIAEHSLKSSLVIRQRPSGVSAALARAGVSPNAVLLFPSADAEQLETLPPERYPKEIIVVDGTWGNAKNLLRDVPELWRYRRLKFTPSQPSAYRIRKEPRADYLSTIESVAYVLRYLEPDTEGLHHLEETFSKMIDRNILARRPSEYGSRSKRRDKEMPHQFPTALATSPDKLVVAYCEGASRFAGQTAAQRFEKEPLVVYLKRLEENETLRFVLRTNRQLPERLLQHLALGVDDVTDHSLSRAEARERISNWIRPGEVLVVWNASSVQMLQKIGLEVKSHLLLKGTYCDYLTYLSRRDQSPSGKSKRSAWGGMEEFISELRIPAPVCRGKGRGALRLVQTEALLRWILPFCQGDCAFFRG